MKVSVKHRMLALCACLMLSSAAYAQYSPDATMDLGAGYGQIAMSQSVLDGTRAIGKNPTNARMPAGTMRTQPSAADMASMRRLIEPEYRRRVRTDGKASADLWLTQTAREMGLQAGRAARAGAQR